MFCKNCGKELKDGALFCTGCGQKVLMPGASAQSRQPEVQKPVQRVSVPKSAGKSKSGVNVLPWIVVGILMVALAVVGYFLWLSRSDHPAEDDEVIETMEETMEDSMTDSMPEDVQEPSDSEDAENIAPSELAEEPEETEPAEEPEEEAPEEEEVSQYFLPTSSTEYLSMSDLEGFSQDDCRMARNELYARHGRRFDDPNLQAYFDALDWYEGTIEPADFDESVMNDYEIANRDLIVQYEKNMGYR